MPVLVSSCTGEDGRVLDDDVGAVVYPVRHVDAFEVEVVDDARAHRVLVVLVSFFAAVAVGFAVHVHSVRADPLRDRPDVPGEDLLDQILELAR